MICPRPLWACLPSSGARSAWWRWRGSRGSPWASPSWGGRWTWLARVGNQVTLFWASSSRMCWQTVLLEGGSPSRLYKAWQHIKHHINSNADSLIENINIIPIHENNNFSHQRPVNLNYIRPGTSLWLQFDFRIRPGRGDS